METKKEMTELATTTKEIYSCYLCKKEILPEDSSDIDGEFYCEDCKSEHFISCAHCEDLVAVDELCAGNDEPYCETCFDKLFIGCSDCGKLIFQDEATETNNGNNVCQECYDANYFICDGCGGIYNRDDENYCDRCDVYRCRGCLEQDHSNCDDDNDYSQEWHNIPQETDYKPSLIKIDRFVGVEMELEKDNWDTRMNDIADKLPDSVGIKSDSSLDDGIEIVTPPCRLGKLEEIITKVCKVADDNNLVAQRSCGLHIHIDANDFRDDNSKILHVLQTYYVIEPIIYSILPRSRYTGTFSVPLRKKYTNEHINGISPGDLDLKWYSESPEAESLLSKDTVNERKGCHSDRTRYFGLNLHSIYYRGTLELRYHSGTSDRVKIINWIHLNLVILDWILHKFSKPRLDKLNTNLSLESFIKFFKLEKSTAKYLTARVKKFSSGEDDN